MKQISSTFPSSVRACSSELPFSFREGAPESQLAKSTLEAQMASKNPIEWLTQVHGNNVVGLPSMRAKNEADAVFTRKKGVVCAVRTADCLPILLSSTSGDIVAAIHAGWRGLHSEIIKQTISAMQIDPTELLAWFGPAICQQHFEVGEEVYEKFLSLDPKNSRAFVETNSKKFLADLYEIARIQLTECRVPDASIHGGKECTFHDQRFHSHRRDGEHSGRIASAIMII